LALNIFSRSRSFQETGDSDEGDRWFRTDGDQRSGIDVISRRSEATLANGSLGAVIVLLLWFYVLGASLLFGAEINSVIEDAAAAEGHPDAKFKGEKAPAVPDNQAKVEDKVSRASA